ncbi:MAG TPA: TolC family protein [Gemmatimonadales bacterium]|nr:TolC family protein [Gemmatimonadales bacterium]
MTVRHLLACALLPLGLALPGTVSAQARPITLDQALAESRDRSPEIRSAEAEVRVARADLKAARVSPYNPEAGFSIGPSSNDDTTLTSYQVGVSQTIELGGKRGLRTRSAARRVEAAEARLLRAKAVSAAAVRRDFFLAVIARSRLSASIEADSVTVLLRDAAQERLRLGAGTQLEVNVAAAASAQARRARLAAEREWRTSLLRLGATIGLPVADTVIPDGTMPRAELPGQSEDDLVRTALARRADLTALRAEREAAESDVRLARSLTWPDPTLGVSAGKAEDFRVVEFGLSLPLPLWNRGQGARAQAGALLQRAQLTELTATREAEREIRDGYRGLATAIEAERAFDREVVERLGENLALAEQSFRAGKIGLLVFNNIRRDLVEGRLGYLDAIAEVIERQAALEQAVGGAFEISE